MLAAEFSQLLDSLDEGTRPSAVRLARLSDLGREEFIELQTRWPGIPSDLREELVARADELAEDNVDLDFTGLVHVAMADPLPSVRRRAIEAAWESRGRETASQLRALLTNDEDESVRAAAATGLEPFVLATELGEFDAEAGNRVVEALRTAWSNADESMDVRARAVESLGARSLPWVTTVITDAYYAEDARLRVAAVRAMGDSAQENWLEYLEETATSDDPEMRYETAAALGLIGSEAGIEILADMLNDDDPEVLSAVISALGMIGGEDAVDHLSRIDVDESDALAEAIEEALEAARYADDQPDLLRSRIGL